MAGNLIADTRVQLVYLSFSQLFIGSRKLPRYPPRGKLGTDLRGKYVATEAMPQPLDTKLVVSESRSPPIGLKVGIEFGEKYALTKQSCLSL